MGYIDDLANLQEQMKNYMERLNNGKLSKRDSSLMIQVAGSYYEALEGYQKQEQERLETTDAKVAFDDILNKISAFQDSIIKDDSQEIKVAFEDLSKAADDMIMEAKKQELLMDVFKTDLKEMELHEAKMRSLQSIVDMDIKLYGSVSKVTLEVLDVQHCKLDDNYLVQEKDENDVETRETIETIGENEEKAQETEEVKTLNTGDILKLKLPKINPEKKKEVEDMLFKAGARYHKYVIPANKSSTHKEIRGKNWYVRVTEGMDLNPFTPYIKPADNKLGITDKKESGQSYIDREQSYQGSAYLKGTGEKQKPTILYGSSPEDIITTLQGWNKGRTEDMQMQTCYIRKLNPETNKYENAAKYEIASGIDITPIYLNLPHMSRDKFTKIVAELKSNGAKYNPVKKAFFITKQNDLNQFAEYLPMSGTQAATGESRSQNELSYEIESGQEYYDNRVKITVEGMESFNVYGDDYDVHFPSLSAESTREIIEKFVLPELDAIKKPKAITQEVEYNGRKYDPLQYDVLELAVKQNFTKEQMILLERPELSSDRLNEIRFAIKDGLSEEQIAKFATPAHEQWQMDLCRIGMQHGMSYDDIKPVINPEGYSVEQWGERRNQLAQMIKEQERELSANLKPNLPSKSAENKKGDKGSVITKLNQNKAKLEAERTDGPDFEKRERSNAMEK